MLTSKAHTFLKHGFNFVQSLRPSKRIEKSRLSKLRTEAFTDLDRISRSTNVACPVKNVLVDGTWYNPNYWARYTIFRKSLNLSQAQETAVLGPYSRKETKETLKTFGITKHFDLGTRNATSRHVDRAKQMLREIKAPADILTYPLPHGFPGSALYDGILKRQRRATIKLDDPNIAQYIAEFFSYLEDSESLISGRDFDLLVISHALDYTYLSLVWVALKKNIPVIVLYGEFGSQRFMRLEHTNEIYAYPNRPTSDEMYQMSAHGKASLAKAGQTYLDDRVSGKTGDVGAVYAYQKRQAGIDRDKLCQTFDWDPQKPIIGVYASNWFDYPHATGMDDFTDFLDWINLTLEVAKKKSDVNWLFKSHPCDDWYASIQGSRIEDLVREVNQSHIRAADKSWNGFDLIRTLDGIVTCHGTIGLEATHFNTPVLIAHPGWYGSVDFTKMSGSREEYESNLTKEWWLDLDTERNALKADEFTGWYFAVPEWNKDYIFQDDSYQDGILSGLSSFFARHLEDIDKEAVELHDWFQSSHPYYHIFKISRSEMFALPTSPSEPS